MLDRAWGALSESWRQEVRSFVRAFSGAYLFGIPLLYTMEMWWLGEFAEPDSLLSMLAVTFAANFGMALAIGFRREDSFSSTLEQTVDAVAVGALAGAIVLLALDQLALDDPPLTVLAKIVTQALPLSLGASIANAIFGGDRAKERIAVQGTWRHFANDVGATVTGAVFVSAAIAPTEEIPMLAVHMGYVHLLALIALSLAIGYGIVFASGFSAREFDGQPPLFQDPVAETTLAYLVSLLVSVVVLFVTQQITGADRPLWILEQTLVLGLPAMIGGAAGRLAI